MSAGPVPVEMYGEGLLVGRGRSPILDLEEQVSALLLETALGLQLRNSATFHAEARWRRSILETCCEISVRVHASFSRSAEVHP